MSRATSQPASQATLTPPARPDAGDDGRAATTRSAWDTTLIVLTLVVAAGDLGVQLLTGLIPPLLVVGLAGLGGVALLRGRPRAGRIVLLVVAVLGVLAGGAFALPALPHLESPVDFVHAVTSLPLRLVAGSAAIAALRGATRGAVTVRRVALGGLVALVALSAVAAVVGREAVTVTDDDVVLVAEGAAFVDGHDLTVGTAQRLVVDNADPLRHTFTVEDTDVDIELPAGRTVAVALDLPDGTYDYICSVPGHEAMVGTLTVQG